jgi:predicted secreted protein with PEFG-CTERM motif
MLGILVFHTAEAEESLSVSTSNDVYYDGDYIVIFGSVKTIFENMPITIQIYYDTNLITIAQPDVAKDGTFAASFYATGTKWSEDGTYTIRAQYTSTEMGVTTFEFFNQMIGESSEIFPVDIPNSGTFDVGYTMRGGEVNDIQMVQERYSLLVAIDAVSNGNLILKLPKDSFDAQNDGKNGDFIILVSKDHANVGENFVQVEYEEIAVSSDYRTIRIPLEEGDKWVEVIGTYVIPEFGSIVIIILVVSVSSAIIISKSRFSVSYN